MVSCNRQEMLPSEASQISTGSLQHSRLKESTFREVEQDDGKMQGNKNISGKLISKGAALVFKQLKKSREDSPS